MSAKPNPPPVFKTARNGATEICSQVFGRPTDPPVILIMGATASMLWWDDTFCQALADKGLQVIRYDNRDTGRSTTGAPGAPGYGLDEMASDVLAVMEAHGLGAAHLAGMSLGGMIAQLAALMEPARVLSLTCISSSAFDEDDPELTRIDPGFLAHFAKLDGLDWSNRDAVSAFQIESARLSANDAERFSVQAARALAEREYDRAINPRSAFNHGGLTGGETWKGRLEEITAPALVIHGLHDPILPIGAGRRLAQRLGDASLIELAGGHELNKADWPILISALRDQVLRG